MKQPDIINSQKVNFENGATLYTAHSKKRASQRGIRNPWIEMVLKDGEVIHKQGLKFHYMTSKSLKYHNPALQERLKNLVVVASATDNAVITCYKNHDAISHIKHKSKRLIKN